MAGKSQGKSRSQVLICSHKKGSLLKQAAFFYLLEHKLRAVPPYLRFPKPNHTATLAVFTLLG